MNTATLLFTMLMTMGIAPNTNVQDSFSRDLMRGFDSSATLRATFDRDIYHVHRYN